MWQTQGMSTTYTAVMKDRWQLEIPSELLRKQKWEPDTQLLMMETPHGVITMTGEQAKELAQRKIGASSLVEDLIAERDTAAQNVAVS